MKTVIFACVHNAGRSQMAAAYFNTLVDPKAARAISAGTRPGDRVHPEVVQVMEEEGIDLRDAHPQKLTPELAAGAHLLITMGCGDECPFVPGLRRDDWPLEDPKGQPIERVRMIRDDIRGRVESLIAQEVGALSARVLFGTPLAQLKHYDLGREVCVLHEFIATNRDAIIIRCRAMASARSTPPPLDAEIDFGVPVFLDQLTDVLRRGLITSPEIGTSAIERGRGLLRQGFTVSQVVHDYGDVCQAVTELAVELNAPISTGDFRTLNRCLDDAIAGAVTEYGRERNQSGIDGESARGSERLGYFAHELRNLLNTSLMAFEVLKTGNVGVVGSTGTVLHRSLMASHALVTRSLAEIRLTQGIQNAKRFAVAAFIDEIASAASLEAGARDVRLTVTPVDEDVEIRADRQVLAAVVGNLLQNAFKFTRPRTTVTLSVDASPERVRIAVRNKCGGLASESVNELFRPFEQRGADRTGVGLGLAFSRWGAEANGGRLDAHNLPGEGCVFSVELPRVPVHAPQTARA